MKRVASLVSLFLLILAGAGYYYWWSIHADPDIVSGPNSRNVLALIRARDGSDTEMVQNAVSKSVYEYGNGEDRTLRKAQISDIPGSVDADIPGYAKECRLISIQGYQSVVLASWECPCCDRRLDRKFYFSGKQLIKISNWHEFLL